MKRNYTLKKIFQFILVFTLSFVSFTGASAEVPDPQQGLRAEWLRGSWGVNWKPENFDNDQIVDASIQDYIDQLSGIRTIDYIQVHLSESNVFSPSHSAPHALLESFWQGDTDENGNSINLVVPSAASGADPFKSWLMAIKAAGFKTMVYVNSYNLLARTPGSEPSMYPDFSNRWMEYCDSNVTMQAFINSQTYHTGSAPRRPYMFCYAEFVLKEYAIRYGDLIDAWGFDSADNIMADECGDEPSSEDVEDQRIYEAFANACHAGNPNAAVAFNNSVGTAAKPFSTATYFDDYTFGHPFGGAGDMVETESLYNRNFGVCEFMRDHSGYPFRTDDRDWNDNVVGRFFPKWSTTSWNAGATGCLTDEQFVEWNTVGITEAGSILWGAPLVRNNLDNSPILTMQPTAIAQLELLDAALMANQNSGQPNWSRQSTVLPKAYIDQAYYHELVQGEDFWDIDGDAVISLMQGENFPSWLIISESSATPGNYILSGTPTDTVATDYTFILRAQDATNVLDREVEFYVLESQVTIPDLGDGKPVWLDDNSIELNTQTLETFSEILLLGRDFYDFEGDDLTISIKENPQWITSHEVTDGVWELTATPAELQEGTNNFILTLSDGISSVDKGFTVVVNQRILEKTAFYQNAELIAAADSIYGVDNVATILSDILTAPDGLATFQLSVDVTPSAGKSIVSAGGVATTSTWGFGADGRDATKEGLFFGDSADWANIGNVKVINFNANGSLFKISDFTDLILDSVKVVNAQSGGKDAVAYEINSEITDLGNVATSPFTLDIPNVKHFALGTGTTANMDKNKWTVEALSIAYSLGSSYVLSITSDRGAISSSLDLPAYKKGTEVTLIARADSAYYFTAWEGNLANATIKGDTITFLMDANKHITATYDEIYRKLEVSAENGTIVVAPDQEYFNIGEAVQLIAVPDPGYVFDAWDGDLLGAVKNEDTLNLTMFDHKSITATFTMASAIPTSMEEMSFTIYPNPSSGMISVKLEQNSNASYAVYNLNGVQVLHGSATASFDLDMSAFEKGLYLLRIVSERGHAVSQIILN